MCLTAGQRQFSKNKCPDSQGCANIMRVWENRPKTVQQQHATKEPQEMM